MQCKYALMAAGFIAAGLPDVVTAQSVCGGDVVFQCATDNPDHREQITVCAADQTYALTRHALASGDMYYDTPLMADANTTWFNWSEGDHADLEIGFWSTDLGQPVTLHVSLPWDDGEETVADQGSSAMWLQSPHWQQQVDQVWCAPDTIYANLETMWPAQIDRGPVASFFSQDVIVPHSKMVGVARVDDTPVSDGVPVYATARPNAATPIWWMLQAGDTVDVLDRAGDFWAVALPTNGVSGCLIRPEQIGAPYEGPCATGWVENRHLVWVQ